ncbi:AAA family ATPase (plasmid) [Chromobacterium amazonense]|uniref:TrlF family AAA-like ATPase n=1 Tax=Chromobacterium amazonense TaxID=1382803 RepID=UPI00237D8414|nr:AAA family ATPase [Chromobacterium amazonense]MDE1714391.1 AAA family ATPase [Chromobacterium amazonense]
MTHAEVDSSRGSLWNRWDPHIHAPGTAMNDQYSGADPWREFFSRVDGQDSPIRALGITDYFLVDTYEQACRAKAAGSLPGVHFLFPNVEIRLSTGTVSSSALNAHLLFSPNDCDHLDRIRRLMAGFKFRYQRDEFRCERSELIRLGRAHDPSIVDERVALTAGVNQFKIDFEELRETWETNDWFRNNCLVAVAAGERDGTSGLRDESSSFAATRTNIEAFAHIIFSGNPKQAEFYSGKGRVSLDELNAKWGGVKPCLHGSDAHAHSTVGKPALDRFCWLKGALTFETLRQACMNPDGRAFIGKEPPRGALPSNAIRSVSVSNAPWMSPSSIELNSGLIAIIGARGSGKTALADFIAMGGCAVSRHLSDRSFLRRAADHLKDSEARLHWESGDQTFNAFTGLDAEELVDAPHVQYLSQQFVDQLCSAEGLEDPLVREIERVVFDAHPDADRLNASSFAELLDIRLEGARTSRTRYVETISRVSEMLTAEQARKDGLPALLKDREEKQRAIVKDEKDMKALIPNGNEVRAKRLDQLSEAVDAKRAQVLKTKVRLEALQHLTADVDRLREEQLPGLIEDLRQEREEAALSAADWEQFRLVFAGDIDTVLTQRVLETRRFLSSLEGEPTTPITHTEPDPNVPLVGDNDDLSNPPLSLLERELERLRKLVGMDAQNARRFKVISDRVSKAKIALSKLEAEINKGNGAAERMEVLRQQRRAAYVGVFQAVLDEESELADLYQPLKAQIAQAPGSLSKLAFTVRRDVDLAAWCDVGESMLDLRLSRAFKGKGSLRAAVELILADAWRSGDAAQAGEALLKFVGNYSGDLRGHRPDHMEPKEWARRVSAWLFSTDHIAVGYGLEFDGVPIERLSPGTRGIVLLLLYLAVDSQDDRPLIVDQPEENLDPQSIYDELVVEFQRAKLRRQVIIVTHNANLVVNTDADQVIVTRCGDHEPGRLPRMSYVSGGLEDPAIREAVCAILEGGKRAFQERAKRLRVSL